MARAETLRKHERLLGLLEQIRDDATFDQGTYTLCAHSVLVLLDQSLTLSRELAADAMIEAVERVLAE